MCVCVCVCVCVRVYKIQFMKVISLRALGQSGSLGNSQGAGTVVILTWWREMEFSGEILEIDPETSDHAESLGLSWKSGSQRQAGSFLQRQTCK